MSSSSAAGFSLEGVDDVQDFPWFLVDGLFGFSGSRSNDVGYIRIPGVHGVQRPWPYLKCENDLNDAVDITGLDTDFIFEEILQFLMRDNGNMKFHSSWISHFLKHRPPSASEYRPLSGLDPTTHAGLALKDAEKVMSLKSNFVTSYILKANALILLEKYELARDVICSGLQIDSQSYCMNQSQLLVGILSAAHACFSLWIEVTDALCVVQFCLLVQEHARSDVTYQLTGFSSVTLNNIIQKNFPEEYAERKSENDSLTNLGVDLLPLFVMDVILPCQKFQLNIFEPRYRLMVRRIMEGNRRMGMAVVDSSTGSIADYACEVEITEYRIAEVEWVQDTYPPEGTERNDLLEMTQKAAEFASQWIKDAQEAAQGDRVRLAELFKAEGLMPPTRDPERFSFWLATLTNRRPSERLDLLRIRDTKERIRRGLLYMKAEEQGCRLQ
ncbi:hypothetical protein DH2020_043203 [Rehmannia glutinosa]|uniref:Lon N-terminal domain-containing protein n=1 Tax=Rehmannia glutinosa TaxID=99300 RepID=A0ABR0UKT2_REHGL